MTESKSVILSASEEAAKFVTGISGWVDRHGRFFGSNEQAARWSGATHSKCCECGCIVRKGHTACNACCEKKELAKYNALPSKVWVGATPLYSDCVSEYFFDEDSLRDYLSDTDETIESLRLVLCRPVKLSQIDYDFFADDLPEDMELPEVLGDAIDAFNEVVKSVSPMAWEPDKIAAIVALGE